jgi:hypothetical protein
MAGAAAGVEHAPALDRGGVHHVRCDRRSDRVEVPGLEESGSMTELLRAIAAGNQASSSAVEQIDVTIAREVEAVAIAANQGAGGAGEKIKTADGAAQQSMAGAGRARHHGAAPSSPTA